VVRQMRRRLHHAPGIARGAHTPAFAGLTTCLLAVNDVSQSSAKN
jgi:hypothetical protein